MAIQAATVSRTLFTLILIGLTSQGQAGFYPARQGDLLLRYWQDYTPATANTVNGYFQTSIYNSTAQETLSHTDPGGDYSGNLDAQIQADYTLRASNDVELVNNGPTEAVRVAAETDSQAFSSWTAISAVNPGQVTEFAGQVRLSFDGTLDVDVPGMLTHPLADDLNFAGVEISVSLFLGNDPDLAELAATYDAVVKREKGAGFVIDQDDGRLYEMGMQTGAFNFGAGIQTGLGIGNGVEIMGDIPFDTTTAMDLHLLYAMTATSSVYDLPGTAQSDFFNTGSFTLLSDDLDIQFHEVGEVGAPAVAWLILLGGWGMAGRRV